MARVEVDASHMVRVVLVRGEHEASLFGMEPRPNSPVSSTRKRFSHRASRHPKA